MDVTVYVLTSSYEERYGCTVTDVLGVFASADAAKAHVEHERTSWAEARA